MASKSVKERRFLAAPEIPGDGADTGNETDIPEDGRRKRIKRNANVYDAVAGRVTTTHPLDEGSGSDLPSHHIRTPRHYRRDPTLAPEEVLFRRLGAPVRYAEKDIYQAHEGLRDGGRDVLPDSDMLKAIHAYSSHFYAALATRQQQGEALGRNINERSMDETALLAFGILVEEASREVLGKTGDLVFTEGVEMERDGLPGDEAENVDSMA
ncbi:uncharacterized protein F4822DRAFT_206337 [Hypoxylon trugodes]|uniref:uncharacterized protein n=1 Tax=Hypoxylon trugodes TaxID=326681 RepID=UPI002198A534|nr:uncharacterized protein F4822DRAFT_206337 [Hypoxylon trugodes]KAI1389621.1 hypothetical protein F4822DRAFT_206337 [Hypoxylon trugodes]